MFDCLSIAIRLHSIAIRLHSIYEKLKKTSVFDIHDMRTVKKHYTIEIYAAIIEGKKHRR